MSEYKITRQQVVEAARSLLGIPFKHQGRNPKTGLDCVGFVVAVAQMLKYPQIIDKTDYRRMPNREMTLNYLRKNLDEIGVEEVKAGDLYLIQIGERATHVGIRVNDETDVEKGIHPSFIHAKAKGFRGQVREEFCHKLTDGRFVRGFRLRGIID